MGALRNCTHFTLGLVVLLATAPLRAAEINRYLPEDTEVISTLNVKQILESHLVKKHGVEALKELLKNIDEVGNVLKDLDFDPFKDLDRITAAGPGGNDQDKGMVIFHGRFDLAKFRAKGEEAAKDYGELLKIHKVPNGQGEQLLLYEVTVSELPMPLFVALPNRDTLLASFGKDYVVDALRRKGKPVLKDKDFQALLEKMDPRASWGMAMVRGAWANADLPAAVKDALNSLEALGGTLVIEDEITLELIGNAKNAKAAQDIRQKVNDGLNTGLGILAILAGQQKELAPVLDFAKSIKCTARDKTIILKASVTGEMIEKALKKKDD